jgi:hypothetical protein
MNLGVVIVAIILVGIAVQMYRRRMSMQGATDELYVQEPYNGLIQKEAPGSMPGQKLTAAQVLVPGDENFRPLMPGSLNSYDEDPAFKYPRYIVKTQDLVRVGDPRNAPKTIIGAGVPSNDPLEVNMLGVATDRVNSYKVNPFKDYGAIDLGLSSVAILDAAADYDTVVSNTRYQKIFGGTSDLRAPPIVDPNPSNVPIGASPGPSFYFPSPDYFAARSHIV